MGSTFNPQILVDKLSKLNSSQQSIETLSHWCIFHMNKAKLVVETWERQFHCATREQRICYLYLANDILQNSRKKGADFVGEFWRVLPEALRDVITNGDDFARKAALRLINIWDERKVFGSCGRILKEEFIVRQPESNSKSEKQLGAKIRPCVGNTLDKVVSDYEAVYGGPVDEDSVVNRCNGAISTLEIVVKDVAGGSNSGKITESEFGEKLKGQHASLKECINQLTALEASRTSLVSHLKEAIQEQESKLEHVRGQLRAALLKSEQVTNLCQQLVSSDNTAAEPSGKSQTCSIVATEVDSRKSTAAVVAAKLAASTSSAEMLSHVINSWAEKMLGNSSNQQPLSDHHQSEKRLKVENGAPPANQELPPGERLYSLSSQNVAYNNDGYPYAAPAPNPHS